MVLSDHLFELMLIVETIIIKGFKSCSPLGKVEFSMSLLMVGIFFESRIEVGFDVGTKRGVIKFHVGPNNKSVVEGKSLRRDGILQR